MRKFFFQEILRNLRYACCVYAGALRMREGHTYIIIGQEQSAKVISAKFSFCSETESFLPRMFSAIG